jgi:hypothetical protein
MNFFTKSLFTKSAVTSSQWDNLFKYIANEGLAVTDVYWYIEIDRKRCQMYWLVQQNSHLDIGYGGAVAKQAPSVTSFAHRNAVLSFQLSAGTISGPFPSDGVPFLNKMLTALDPNPQAACMRYFMSMLCTSINKLAWFRCQLCGSHAYPCSVETAILWSALSSLGVNQAYCGPKECVPFPAVHWSVMSTPVCLSIQYNDYVVAASLRFVTS